MPRPLLAVFLAFALIGVGLVVWVFAFPPSAGQVALELRRSPPNGTLTHDVVEARLVAIPSPLPATTVGCAAVTGVVIEGGPPAHDRIGTVLRSLCELVGPNALPPPELKLAVGALSRARIRFALFTRTGNLSTADLATGRIMIAKALSRTNVAPVLIAPLLVHEGYHLSQGLPVTATQEFRARIAELAACRLLIAVDRFPRGCEDAQAMVRLGEARAVDLLARAGFPR